MLTVVCLSLESFVSLMAMTSRKMDELINQSVLLFKFLPRLLV